MIGIDRPLHTRRLRLEPVTELLCVTANEGVDALAGALDADIPPDWIRAGLPLVRQRPRAPRPWRPMRAVVVHSADARVIGDVRFELTRDPDETVFEIGYSIIPAYRRRGYAHEAAGAIVDWLFEAAGAELLIAGCDRRNKASIKTLRKLGFWLDGSRGDAFWWRMTHDLRAERRFSDEQP